MDETFLQIVYSHTIFNFSGQHLAIFIVSHAIL